jgi:tetratricopeptide (TPR) repeat protein
VTIRNLVGPAASPHVQTAFTLRLWRHRPLYRFVGRVHEQILPAILACAPQAQVTNSGVVVIHYGYTQETMTAKAKSERNMRLLRAELERRPEDLFLQFHLGLEYTIQGRHQAACQLFKSVWTRLPVATPWRSKLVKVYGATLLALRRGDQALNLLTAERDRYPDYTDLYFLIGQAHGQRGDHALAAAAFAECLRLGPAPAPPYVDADEEMGTCRAALALGRAQEALGDRAAALAAYRSAANCRPGWLEPLGYLAQLLVSVLDDAALEAELRSFFPAGDSRDLQSLARIFAQVGRYQAALMLVEAAAALGELEPMSRYVRASCLGLLGRFAEALDASAGAWAGTGLTVRVEALRLYASLMMGQPVPPELAERREDEVKALYAEVAELLEGAPPASFQARIGFLPRHRLLVAALRRRAAARAHAPG